MEGESDMACEKKSEYATESRDVPNGTQHHQMKSEFDDPPPPYKSVEAKMITNKKDLVILVVLCLVEFHGFFSFSMIAPFYPLEAGAKYHVKSSIQGLVFAIHPLIVFLLSPYVGKLISKPGRTKRFILLGTVGIAAGNFLFAFVTKFDSKHVFLALSFLARIMISVGTAFANTASLAFLTEKFKTHLSLVFGITELFVGVGFMSGPSVGSVLYGKGRWWLPFIVVAVLNILNLICLWFFIPGDLSQSTYNVNNDANDDPSTESPGSERKITIKRSLKIPAVWIVCLTIHTIGFFLTFIQPTFSLHLKAITHNTISIERIGLVFFLCPAIYAVLAPILGVYVDKWFIPRNLIIVGHFLAVLCYLFMGPTPLFKAFAKPSLTLTSVAYGFLGVAQCPIMVPVIADLQLAITNAGYPNGQRTSSIVSALFTSAINLGQVMGPFIGGILQEHMAFPWSSTIVAIFILVEGIVILIFTMWELRSWNIFSRKPGDIRPADNPPDNTMNHEISNEGVPNVSFDPTGDVMEIEDHIGVESKG